MTKSFLTKKIFSIFAIFTFVLISTTTLAHAGVIQNIKYFLFGEQTTPTVVTTPITNPSTGSGQTNTTVVVPPSTSGISENDIYLALTKISRLPDNIISQLRGPQGPQGQKGDTGAKGSSGLSTYSNTGNTPVVTPPATTIVYTGSSGGSSSSASYWKKDGHDIYYDKGSVGINTNTPEANLSIQSSDSVEKIVNGDFNGNADHWTLGAGWVYADGKITDTPGETGILSQAVTIKKGRNYEYSFDISNITQGNACLNADDGFIDYISYSAGDKTYTGTFFAEVDASSLNFDPNCDGPASFDASIDNFSFQELSPSVLVKNTDGEIGFSVDNSGNAYFDNNAVFNNGITSTIGVTEAGFPTAGNFSIGVDDNSTADFTNSGITGVNINAFYEGNGPMQEGITGLNISASNAGVGSDNTSATGIFIDGGLYTETTGGNYWGIRMNPTVGGNTLVDEFANILIGDTGIYEGGSITNNYALKIDAPYGDDADTNITNNYGIYITDQSGSGTDKSYNIYSAGSASKNYFQGNVGIGNTTPSVALDVTGDIEYTGTITDVSDRRLKDNIQDYGGALDIISNLQAKSYNMISTPDKNEVGFIAQDVQSIFPNATSIIDPEKGYLGVSYVSLVPVIAQAVKELNLKLLDINKIEEPNSIREAIVAWFGDTANGIVDFFAGRVHTKEICVAKADGSEFCANGDQLEQAVSQGGAIVNPNPDPMPDPTPTPDPTPEPEPTPDPVPEITPPSDPAPDVVPPSDPAPNTDSQPNTE